MRGSKWRGKRWKAQEEVCKDDESEGCVLGGKDDLDQYFTLYCRGKMRASDRIGAEETL